MKTKHQILLHFVTVFLVLFTANVALCSTSRAFYWNTIDGTQFRIQNIEMNASTFANNQGESAGKRVATKAQYDFNHRNGWVIGFGHQYSDLDIVDSVAAPEGNGHFHTLHLATQWKTTLNDSEFRIVLSPALSVSSNALKELDILDSDSFQYWGAAIYTRRSNNINWIIGAGHDYRFGERKVYPIAGLEWSRKDVHLRATFPDFELMWNLSPNWAFSVTLEPDGNEWQVFNKELTRHSQFRREGWQSNLELKYQFESGFAVGVNVGKHWQQNWQYLRQDGCFADLDGSDRTYFGLSIGFKPNNF